MGKGPRKERELPKSRLGNGRIVAEHGIQMTLGKCRSLGWTYCQAFQTASKSRSLGRLQSFLAACSVLNDSRMLTRNLHHHPPGGCLRYHCCCP